MVNALVVVCAQASAAPISLPTRLDAQQTPAIEAYDDALTHFGVETRLSSLLIFPEVANAVFESARIEVDPAPSATTDHPDSWVPEPPTVMTTVAGCFALGTLLLRRKIQTERRTPSRRRIRNERRLMA